MTLLLEMELPSTTRFQHRSPALVFSAKQIHDRARELSRIAEARRVHVLLAVKAVPHAAAIALIGPWVQGFDVSNAGEFLAVREFSRDRLISLTGPVCSRGTADLIHGRSAPTIVNAETTEQVAYTCALRDAAVVPGVRLRAVDLCAATNVTPPFGFEEESLAQALTGDPALARQIRAVHTHGGGRDNTVEIIVARAAKCLEIAGRLGIRFSYANFGGGFARLSLPELQHCLSDLVLLSGNSISVMIEPGEYFFAGCGWAEATVLDVTSGTTGARAILDISSEAHLRWSQLADATSDKYAGDGGECAIDFVGPTCHRGDFLGRRWIKPSLGRPYGVKTGDRVKITGITSYSAGWNSGFNGIAQAAVIIVDT